MSDNGNTYIFDPNSPTELARLINLDRVTTQAMGGPFAGLSETEIDSLNNVLDLGCGPGGWVLDAAFQHSEAEIAGVDISRSMIDYANARARSQGRTNASFGVADITQPLDFTDETFDLVNARYLLAVLKKDVWPQFLAECHRVLRPGGFLRLTEPADFGLTSSENVNMLMNLVRRLLATNQYEVSEHSPMILPLPKQWVIFQEYQNMRLLSHVLDYSAATEAWADTYHNIEVIGVQMKDAVVRLGLTTDRDFDNLYQRALIDLNSSTFSGLSHWTTIMAQKPSEEAA